MLDEIRSRTDRDELQWWADQSQTSVFKALHMDGTVLTLRERKFRSALMSLLAREPRFKTCGGVLNRESEEHSTNYDVDSGFISAVKSQLKRRG